MAGLFDVDPNTPAGTADPRAGDNELRALKFKVREFAYLEHDYDGVHAFPKGSLAQRPAFGRPGRFYVLITPGKADELQWDNGGAWVNLSSNQIIVDNAATGTSAHKTLAVLDHPDGSVTSIKIANEAVIPDKIIKGGILKKHLDGTTDNTSLAALVSGGNADTLHSHLITSPLTLVTSGVQTFAHAVYGTNLALNDSIDITLNVSSSLTKKYILVVRPFIHTGPNVGTDDSSSWNLAVYGSMIAKSIFTAPQTGPGDFGEWGTYYARLTATGTYTMTYAGAAGPTYINIDVNYAVYEVN